VGVVDGFYAYRSKDGVNWTKGELIVGGADGSECVVAFDGTYFHFAHAKAYMLQYRRGVPNPDGTITLGSIYTVLDYAFKGSLTGYTYQTLYATNYLISGNIYSLKDTYEAENYSTQVSLGSYGANYVFVFNPFYNESTPCGTSLPSDFQSKGWRIGYGKGHLLESKITVYVKLRNPTTVAHSGKLWFRLWKDDDVNLGSPTLLIDWTSIDVSFDGTLNQVITSSKDVYVFAPVGNAKILDDETLYIEFAWQITSNPGNGIVQIEANGGGTYVYFPTRSNTVYGIDVDSDGYPWFAVSNDGGGAYKFPYIIKNNAKNGTSDFRYVTVRKLSLTYSLVWRVIPVCLTGNKVLAIYLYSGGRFSQYWDGTSWGSQKSFGTGLAGTLYHSVVAYGDTVHFVYLEYGTYDIEHWKWTPDSWNSVATIQSATTSTSAPVLSVTSTGDLYVFWAGSPTANHIYYKKYVEAWDASPTDWIDESTEALTGNDRLTCFYKQYGNYIGLLYMTKTTSEYNVKFAFLTLVVARYIGDGLSGAVVFV
jgi:hypothetical protein